MTLPNTSLPLTPAAQATPAPEIKIPKQPDKPTPRLHIILGAIIVVAGVWGLYQTLVNERIIDLKKAQAEEKTRPADLSLVIITDKKCQDCASLDPLLSSIQSKNVNFADVKNYDVTTNEAQALISKYKAKNVPFFTLTGELGKNTELQSILAQLGTTTNNVFVLTSVPAPYRQLADQRVIGLVAVTYVTDKACTECYDVQQHKTILEKKYGIKVIKEETVDIADAAGKQIVKKYGLTKVPTFVASSELAAYTSLLSVWKSAGTIESDGSYAFRQVEQMGAYYDLPKKQVVKPAANTNSNTNQSK